MNVLTGKPGPAEESFALAKDALDPIVNQKYYEEGLALLADHFEIKDGLPGLWFQKDVFWFHLAWGLLKRHVPYFMPPTRPGRPPKLQAYLPALSLLMAEIRKGNLDWTVDRAYHEAAEFLACDYETVRREFVRWKQKQGRNSAK